MDDGTKLLNLSSFTRRQLTDGGGDGVPTGIRFDVFLCRGHRFQLHMISPKDVTRGCAGGGPGGLSSPTFERLGRYL